MRRSDDQSGNARMMPLIIALYVFNYMDRTNVGFAALTMNKDLGFSPSVYGLGAGILFVTFALFQVPVNIILDRVGARRWMFCILAVWGAISASNALIRGPSRAEEWLLIEWPKRETNQISVDHASQGHCIRPHGRHRQAQMASKGIMRN
jgi:hypothetical protein